MTAEFDRSQLPPPRSFYEGEGFRLGRANSKGWAMAKGQPPCHKSESGRSFSINVNHGGFVCFGCSARGSMFDYVMARDGCDFRAAAKTLGCAGEGLTFAEQAEILRRQRERAWNRQREIEQEETERRQRIELRDELHLAARLYSQVAAKLHEIGPEANDHWAVLPLLLDDLRLSESAYCRAAGLENPYE